MGILREKVEKICLPCNLCTPFCFLSHDADIPESIILWKRSSFHGLKAMNCSLFSSPCCFACFLTKILSVGESRLVNAKMLYYMARTKEIFGLVKKNMQFNTAKF